MVRRWRNAVLVLLCLTAALNGQERSRTAAERLDPLLDRLFSLGMSPGMSVAVVQEDSIIYARGFGYADLKAGRRVKPDTYFYIASTTKSLTAFACAMLARQGRVDFSKPVQDYVPDLRLHPDIDPRSVTLQRLLTHTHGLDGMGPVVVRTAYTGDHTYGRLLELTALHGPSGNGYAFDYSNIGYNIAGFVMQEVTGMEWKSVVKQLVLDPLGMNDTRADVSSLEPDRTALPYAVTPDGFEETRPRKSDRTMHAAGGHYTTALDMAAWIGMQLNHGVWMGKRIFPPEVVGETQRKHTDQDRMFGQIHRYGWGLGWDLGTYAGDTLIHRFGSYAGFRSHVSFMPSRRLGVVVLVNEASLGSRLADATAFAIYDELSATPAGEERVQTALLSAEEMVPKVRESIRKEIEKRAARAQELPHAVTSYTGTFVNQAYGTFTVRVRQGKLLFKLGELESPAEVYDSMSNKFRVELTGSGSVISFEMSAEQARSLVFNGITFNRVE